MKIAMIGDLHGNFVATQALEKALDKVQPDEIWFLGDAVGKGPQNVETCDWVRRHCTLCVGGNWDYGIGGKEFAEDGYFWAQLGEERLHWLNSLPREAERWISGVRFRLFHGRPVTPLMSAQTDKDVFSQAFHPDGRDYTGIIFADSHRPFVRTLHDGYAVNTGSVGNSLGVNRAHCAIVEGEMDGQEAAPLAISILSVPYDNEAAAEIARQDVRLPHRESYITEVLTGVYSR
ncbi:MAG: metallophosphoesterase family protein [Clostridia bacterium]|nr:metallophosphoesterase family protein [Clostridia bacterium]